MANPWVAVNKFGDGTWRTAANARLGLTYEHLRHPVQMKDARWQWAFAVIRFSDQEGGSGIAVWDGRDSQWHYGGGLLDARASFEQVGQAVLV